MNDCVFCKIIRGDEPSYKIWEDDECYVFLSTRPVNPGHTLVIPKRHIDSIWDIEDPLFTNLFQRSKELSQPIRRTFDAPRVGVAIEGFSVPHAHIHLVPVYHMAELDPNRGKRANPEALAEVQEKILRELR
jgi:histidine triad (HIT) family protein